MEKAKIERVQRRIENRQKIVNPLKHQNEKSQRIKMLHKRTQKSLFRKTNLLFSIIN